MLLRRITEHVRDQNWFAVAIDFLIVLAGILIAFQITNWNEARSERAELVRAEISLQNDLGRNYFNAAERISLAGCRKAQLTELANRLMTSGETWESMARQDPDLSSRAFERVLRSPSRVWGSRLWEAGLSRGTFNRMEDARRQELDLIFEQTRYASRLQDDILSLQARLKLLSQTTELSRSDRIRYLDVISEIDEYSVSLEHIAGQIVQAIEEIGITLDEATRSEARESLSQHYDARKSIYGDCAKPITLPHIEEIKTESTP